MPPRWAHSTVSSPRIWFPPEKAILTWQTNHNTMLQRHLLKWTGHQLNLPSSLFFLITLWPWYTNESNIPETVKIPEKTYIKNTINIYQMIPTKFTILVRSVNMPGDQGHLAQAMWNIRDSDRCKNTLH